MRSYKCEVERVDRYEVEFDESICNEEWMEEFRDFFYNFYTLEEHAEHIVQCKARFKDNFIEGYGVPLVNGEVPVGVKVDQVNHSINIKVISEDDIIYVDVG